MPLTPGVPKRLLPVLLLVALLLRLVWWAAYVGIIENEGVEYARLAHNWFHGRGYVSIFGGTHTLFPPLYPLLIGFATPLAGSEEPAARLVSLVGGLLLVWALYRLGAECFSPWTGAIAGALAAVHPLLIALSVSTYSESVYLGLIALAALLAVRSVSRSDWRLAAAAGAIIGAAYLARPEGIVLAGPMAAIVALGMWRKGPAVALRSAASLGLAAAVVAAPYVAHLSSLAGRFRWEGKSGMNNLIVSRVRSGLTFAEATRGLDSVGNPMGPYLIKDQSRLLQADHASAVGMLHGLMRDPIQRAHTVASRVWYARDLGAPLILLVAALGVILTKWWRTQPVGGVVLLVLPALTVMALLTLEWIWPRYLFPLLPAGLLWAAAGFERIAAASRTAAFLLAAFILASAGRRLPRLHDISQTRQQDLRATGEWIRADFRQSSASPWRPRVLAFRTAIAHYARGELVYPGWGDEVRALKYVHAVSPDYLVLRHDETASLPYGEKWFEGEIADACAQEVTTLSADAAAHYRVWRWTCRPSD